MCPKCVVDTRPPKNMTEHIDALNRIIGMNLSIAFNYVESTDYSNSDLINCVVRGV